MFLKLGFTAFGGPAAHIAMMREEVVVKRKWLTEQHFLDLTGAVNLIPGPNSTEMTMHIGHERAGWKGEAGSALAQGKAACLGQGDQAVQAAGKLLFFTQAQWVGQHGGNFRQR